MTRRALGAAVAVLLLTAGVAAPAGADDGIRAMQWALPYLNAQQAWQTSQGAGVTVAVLDTGVVPDRPDLTGQVTTGPDYVGGAETPDSGGELWGLHGTAMASIIAGHGHDYDGGDGVMGIAPQAHILSIRVIRDDGDPDLHAPSATNDPIAAGIRYAVAHGAQVISMSLGGTDDGSTTQAQDQAIDAALAQGVVVVAASGNDAQTGDSIEFPAAEPGVIAVAAIDQNGQHAAFSTTGWDVDVAAPGVDIITDAPDHDYLNVGGTSPACAYVAGVVALIRAKYPKLSPAQIKTLLEQTASQPPAGGRDDQLGAGVVNPVAALRAAAALTPQPEQPAVASYHGPAHFGFGPTIVVRPITGGLTVEQRWRYDGALALLLCVLVAALLTWRALRERRRAPGSPTVSPGFGPPVPGSQIADSLGTGSPGVGSLGVGSQSAASPVLPTANDHLGGPEPRDDEPDGLPPSTA
jgi:type VII secretion-associated serine protease mycosin